MVSTPSSQRKHTQARATVNILSAVRMIGTIAWAGVACLLALGTVIGAFATSGSHVAVFFGGLVATVITAIFGALFYATVGWLVETLSMLTEIARNTARTTF